MPQELTGELIVRNKGHLSGERKNFDTYYQTLHDYFYVEATNVNTTYYPGTELDFFLLLDATSLEVVDIHAAGVMNYLTPTTGRWFQYEHPDPKLRDLKPIRTWMQDAADEVNFVLNRSNYYNQMPIFYKASSIYGTQVQIIEDDSEDDVRFINLPIKNAYITEDARGKPLEYYLVFEYTAEQAITKFGEDKVDKDVVDASKARRTADKKYPYIFYIGPRQIQELGKLHSLAMPFRGAWIEEKTHKVMDEQGFLDMPAVAHRFFKRPLIQYGFSPGMKALPWVRMLNTMADTILRSGMKHADPPIALPDKGFLAPENFNPRAKNYYKKTKLDPKSDIVPIGNYGNPGIGQEFIEYYADQIGSMFFKNAFLSFTDVTKQMTVPEVMQRANEQLSILGPAVGRYMSDVLEPQHEVIVSKLARKGRLPPIPDEMRIRPEFDVKFTGRLAQAQGQVQLNNLVNAFSIAAEISAFKPDALDKINVDAAIDELWSVTNAPAKLLFDSNELKAIRQAKAQQEQAIAQIQAAAEASKAAKDATQADKNAAQASQETAGV